jgi:hypothetical protein
VLKLKLKLYHLQYVRGMYGTRVNIYKQRLQIRVGILLCNMYQFHAQISVEKHCSRTFISLFCEVVNKVI